MSEIFVLATVWALVLIGNYWQMCLLLSIGGGSSHWQWHDTLICQLLILIHQRGSNKNKPEKQFQHKLHLIVFLFTLFLIFTTNNHQDGEVRWEALVCTGACYFVMRATTKTCHCCSGWNLLFLIIIPQLRTDSWLEGEESKKLCWWCNMLL